METAGTPPRSTPPGSPPDDAFDPSFPFRGLVICCTSIPPEQRSDIAAKTAELGGIHKYDLTLEVTHLIVGEYDTPKYRHVARERPDVKAMAAGWVEAVRDLWVQDAEMDFAAVEAAWRLRPLEAGSQAGGGRERLLCCLTGFDTTEERQRISDEIEGGGGAYTGDLSRRVTHLIVRRPEGRKYAAAKDWGVQTVSLEWLADSLQRGMILDEKCYDPVLPAEERGRGAWMREATRPQAKRLREGAGDENKRKLRKTANKKLAGQRENIWGDILGRPGAAVAEPTTEKDATAPAASASTQASKPPLSAPDEPSIFAACCFYVHGFSARQTDVLVNTVASLGGQVCRTLDEAASSSGAQFAHRFLVVPQASRPDTHPPLPDNVRIVTEFYVEKCLHKKRFADPGDHPIGQPFPAFPIDGFGGLAISTAGFTGVDLHHLDKAVRQLGARYEERFTAQASLLVVAALAAVRKQKLDLALAWGVPVVSVDWLWACIATGFKVPVDGYQLAKPTHKRAAQPAQKPKRSIREVDMSAFCHEEPEKAPAKRVVRTESTTSDFETAPTHQNPSQEKQARRTPPPLSELSPNSRPSESPKKQPRQLARIPSEIANSEATDCSVDENESRGNDKAAAERLALSAKLTTLLDATGSDAALLPTAAPAPRPRRKREILGRAVSNVSAASSVSVESADRPSLLGGSFSVGGEEIKEHSDPPAAPLTQLAYDDPDAQKYKQQLMRKMRGEEAGPHTSSGTRLTLSELARHEEAAKRSVGGHGLRSRRKR